MSVREQTFRVVSWSVSALSSDSERLHVNVANALVGDMQGPLKHGSRTGAPLAWD